MGKEPFPRDAGVGGERIAGEGTGLEGLSLFQGACSFLDIQFVLLQLSVGVGCREFRSNSQLDQIAAPYSSNYTHAEWGKGSY